MDEKTRLPLASEMYADLKETNLYLRKILQRAFLVIALLVVALAGTNLYHIYQWSQFETIIVETGEGGSAIFSEGDNSGGIWNGEDRSTTEKEGEIQGD